MASIRQARIGVSVSLVMTSSHVLSFDKSNQWYTLRRNSHHPLTESASVGVDEANAIPDTSSREKGQ
jgi:hypothetical protein